MIAFKPLLCLFLGGFTKANLLLRSLGLFFEFRIFRVYYWMVFGGCMFGGLKPVYGDSEFLEIRRGLMFADLSFDLISPRSRGGSIYVLNRFLKTLVLWCYGRVLDIS